MISTEGKAFWTRSLPVTIPDNLKPLRDKHGACAGCGTQPPPGQTFRTCAACKAILYCSRKCQRSHWRVHRKRCNNTQDLRARPTELEGYAEKLLAQIDPSWPQGLEIVERAVVLDTFIELHWTSIHVSVILLRQALQGRGQDLDGHKHKLDFDFGYRTDGDGNPASWLFLRKLAIKDKDSGEVSSESQGEDEEAKRNKIRLEFCAGGIYVGRWLPLSVVDPRDPEVASRIGDFPMDWAQNLWYMATVGMIFESTDRSSATARAWTMRRVGKVWERTRITGQDMERRLQCDPIPLPEVDMGPLRGSF